jgi:hypothetical protein
MGCRNGLGESAAAWLAVGTSAVALAGGLARTGTAAANARLAIFGLVAAVGGAPVSGCRVEAFPLGRPHTASGQSGPANRAGMFFLDKRLGSGKYVFEVSQGRAVARVPVTITKSASWYRILSLRVPRAMAGSNARRKTSRHGGVRIFGQVTGPNGTMPLAGMSVGGQRLMGWRRLVCLRPQVSNRLGLFAFDGRLRPGLYWIRAEMVSRHPAARGVVASARLPVAAPPQKEIVLRLRAGAGSVGGRVFDSAGQPVVGAFVTLRKKGGLTFFDVRTGVGGRYLMRYVAPGKYTASALCSFGARGHREIGKKLRVAGPYVIVVGRRPVRKNFRLGRPLRAVPGAAG